MALSRDDMLAQKAYDAEHAADYAVAAALTGATDAINALILTIQKQQAMLESVVAAAAGSGQSSAPAASGTVQAQQSGSWNVGQTGAWTVGASNLPTAVDTNSGNKSASTIRVVLATDQPQLTAALKVDGSGVTQPVSGTFWPATQPVSGTVAVSNFPATQPVSGSVSVANLPATQPVSGTFWQNTQPVSIAATVNVSGPLTDTQLRASAVPISAAALPLPSGAALEAGNLATLVSQGAKDLAANRTFVTLSALLATGATSEGLLTLSINKGGNSSSGTSYTVTSGKTFRITSLTVDVLNTTTVANRVQINVRAANGAVSTSSPLIARLVAAAQAALAASAGSASESYPEGICIPGGWQIGISQICSVTTASIVSVCLTGYEY